MSENLYKNSKGFSTRKVSVDQVVRVLGRNGIRVNKEEAEIILDFFYLIAKTYSTQKEHDAAMSWNLRNESNTCHQPFS